MKSKDKKALHDKTVEELQVLLKEKRVQLNTARMDLQMHKSKNVKEANNISDEIARIETIKREKEMQHV